MGIAFDDPAYVTWLAYNPEPETSRLRYGYSSMTYAGYAGLNWIWIPANEE
ncbi:protease 2 [Klebsiella pneumoniae]|uniref:Protease 2 n=1 Tax=Klebsiella pneumoniae TaxID=573 RepID=A0A3S4I189_KLEPN|nr:protease 2 [Klebsiella pneumoniae]